MLDAAKNSSCRTALWVRSLSFVGPPNQKFLLLPLIAPVTLPIFRDTNSRERKMSLASSSTKRERKFYGCEEFRGFVF